ncbi:MAG: NAD-dependent epimerase/dehydratase family protein [Candidatus Kapabacteria bacterium]|nr:NAD-dependent epimerase/dehydratase family protein [Candidatus Kapabacteria bacterium]
MKILVSGGAGFIGSHICEKYIKAGHDVCIIDNLSTGKIENIHPEARFFELDINSDQVSELMMQEKFDILCHQAAQVDVRVSVNDPRFDASTNVLGALNLYEAALKSGVKKIIFASSGGTIYGDQDYFPADEQHPLNPCSPYGISKLINEKYLYYYKYIHGIDFVAFRYANVYGPRQNPHGEAGVVAIFIDRMLNEKQSFINGDGKNSRDYVYVEDVANANLLALGENVSGIYNIGTSVEHDVNFIFQTLNELTGGRSPELHAEAKTGEQRRSVISYKKINEQLGWQPKTDFLTGLSKTVDYFKNKLV